MSDKSQSVRVGVRVVLDFNCPFAPNIPVGTLGWLERTAQHNVVWFDGVKYGLYSRRVSMGDMQIKNYVRVIEADKVGQ
jgi:hypothetical protein